MNPDVSIIIPVYNGSNYLREAIDSALSQSYRNVEVIVVNDGSNDGGRTEDIANSYGNRIRYLYKDNGGVSSAINLGIRMMTGEWFAWLSHDDLFSSNRIEQDMHMARENPDIRVIFCKLVKINEKGLRIEEVNYLIRKVTNPREALMLRGVNVCNMTIHRSCFDKTGLLDENNKTTQDVQFTLLLSKYYPFHFNTNTVTFSREHPRRGTYTLKDEHKKDLLRLSDFISKHFSIKDFFPEIKFDDADKKASEAWSWMGDMYCNFGAYRYADDCYKESHAIQNNFLSIIGMKYILGARKLDSCLFRMLTSLKTMITSRCS